MSSSIDNQQRETPKTATTSEGQQQQNSSANNHASTGEMTTNNHQTSSNSDNDDKQYHQTNETKDQDGSSITENSPKADTIDQEHQRLLDSLIDDVIFCECLQVHRAAKLGMIFTEPGDEMYKIKDGNGLDVFGQPLNRKKQLNCTCPQCGRNIAAARLAPHLEKCMGMGRLSARAASNKRDTSSSQM